MNYKLAKQLKDNGFPQPDSGNYQCETIHAYHYESPEHDADVHFPNLSELIEACGKNIMSIRKVWNENREITNWIAESDTENTITAIGESPTEAVANLWLALNT